MSKTIVFLIIIFLILSGVIVYFYIQHEKSQDNKLTNINLNIFGIESTSKSLVRTGYKVYVNGNLYAEGKTNKIGATLEQVPRNSSVVIYNYNLDKQYYYTYPIKYNNVIENNYRVDLELKELGKLNITHKGKLGVDSNITLNVKSIGYINKLIFCLKGKNRIVYVNAEDFTQLQEIKDKKCFNIGDIEDEELIILINYEKFGQLNYNDYIEVLFYDIDNIPFVLNQTYNKLEVYKII